MKVLNIVCLLVAILTMSCKSNPVVSESADNETKVSSNFEGKVLVTLLKEAKVKELESDFKKYDLKHVSLASKSQNQHLFNFDRDKINSEDLIKKLNKNKNVYLAEALIHQVTKPEMMSSGQKKKVDVK